MNPVDPLYVVTALIGIIASLVACLVWVVKKVFDVVEKNTEASDRVGNSLETMTAVLNKQDTSMKLTIKNTADIARNQKMLLDLLSKQKGA